MADPATPIGFSTIHLSDLRGGTALVPGTSRGIGRAVIDALAAHDVWCYALARHRLPPDLPPHVVLVPYDLGDAVAIEEAVAAAQTGSLDYLVNEETLLPEAQSSQLPPLSANH